MIFSGTTHRGLVPPTDPSKRSDNGRRFDWPLSPPFSTGEIKGPQAAIVFTRPSATSASIPTDISVRVSLPKNGRNFVRYHLDGEIPPRLGERIRDVLSFGEIGTWSPTETLKQLLSITQSYPSVHWTPQRLDCVDQSERLTPPMRHVVPTLEEFVQDPVASCYRFFCAKPIKGLDWRMEAELKQDQPFAIIELSATAPDRRVVEKKFLQLHPKSDTETSLEELTLRCYQTMEQFWELGPEAVTELLLKDQKESRGEKTRESETSEHPSVLDWQAADLFELDQDLMAGVRDFSNYQYTHAFASGAELLLAMGHEAAVLRLRSHPDDAASFFEWRFHNAEGDFSDPADQQRKDILRAFAMLKSQSDTLRLSAVELLNTLKIQYDAAGPKPERVLGIPLADHLAQIPELVVEPHVAAAPSEVVGLFQGKESIRIALRDRSLRERKPHFFNSALLGALPDGSLTVEVANMLNGRCSAVLSPTALKRYGSGDSFVRSFAHALAQQSTRGFSSVQRLLEDACSRDSAGSYLAVHGEPIASELPPTIDTAGLHMYEIAANLVRAYAALSHSTPANYKVAWIAPGTVEATLGMDHEPFLMNLTLTDSKVTKIEVSPQKDGLEGFRESDTEQAVRYSCDLAIGAGLDGAPVGDRLTLHMILDLFSTALSNNDPSATSGDLPLQATQLYHFLEGKFTRA